MDRRFFLYLGLNTISFLAFTHFFIKKQGLAFEHAFTKLVKSDEEWKTILTAEQYNILRQEGTEIPFTSSLNKEKREGIYVCAACDLELFTSSKKYDSGTGWPSFFDYIENSLETKSDYNLLIPRIEYHCARCGGHQGHVFDDGPQPTGLRYCNNGLALKFLPKKI
ncbi:MAG: peptide-methionine (R)-S-oxide reductase MsrB [Alphaproteobacteria bacterium]|nr:peptide-methionine (R)-S-oxide reductase MsrB [Alphaproteobacteria bacterium]